MINIIVTIFLGVINICIICIRMMLNNIIIFESLILGLWSGFFVHKQWGLTTTPCVVIGILIFFLFVILHFAHIGYRILSIVFSSLWTIYFSWLVWNNSASILWTAITAVLSFIVTMLLHKITHSRLVEEQDETIKESDESNGSKSLEEKK